MRQLSLSFERDSARLADLYSCPVRITLTAPVPIQGCFRYYSVLALVIPAFASRSIRQRCSWSSLPLESVNSQAPPCKFSTLCEPSQAAHGLSPHCERDAPEKKKCSEKKKTQHEKPSVWLSLGNPVRPLPTYLPNGPLLGSVLEAMLWNTGFSTFSSVFTSISRNVNL